MSRVRAPHLRHRSTPNAFYGHGGVAAGAHCREALLRGLLTTLDARVSGDDPAGGSSAHVEALGARGGDGDDGGSDDDATDGGGDDGGDPVHADALALRLARFLPPADSTTAGAGDGYSNP